MLRGTNGREGGRKGRGVWGTEGWREEGLIQSEAGKTWGLDEKGLETKEKMCWWFRGHCPFLVLSWRLRLACQHQCR